MKWKWSAVALSFVAVLAVVVSRAEPAAKSAVPADAAINPALSLQNAFSQVAEKTFPAVVVISNKRRAATALYPDMSPEARYFFGLPPLPRQRSTAKPVPVGRGSGFVIRDDGYILTNCHVIEAADALEVKFSDGRVFDSADDPEAVKLVGIDKDTDLAVLRIGNGKLRNLPALAFADTDKTKVGEWAIAVGAPFNLDYSMTVGVVSQKGRNDISSAKYQDYIQTDASINPGNSGGPLLNLRGEVIGINNFILTGGGRGSIGLGFAIAGNLARQVSNSLIENGQMVRPHLGVVMLPLDEKLQEALGAEHGIVVQQVHPGQPAAKAGIEAGDVIQFIGGRKVSSPQDFFNHVAAHKPGDTIPVRLLRNGKPIEMQVNTTVPETTKLAAQKITCLGIEVVSNGEALEVVKVEAGSLATQAGMAVGDIIVSVNRRPVPTVDSFNAALRAGRKTALMVVEKADGERTLVTFQIK
jgi:Do/DeqQ family serine protease